MENELTLRLGFFFGLFIALLLVEHLYPKRKLVIAKKIRWTRNIPLVVINSVLVRILIPFTAASTAIFAQSHNIGLFNYFSVPSSISVALSLILLDFLIYFQHVAFHHIPLLWRLHKVHHIDQEIDFTTGVRFHPLEIIISVLIKCAAVLTLGVPFIAVLIFEILLNATAMFNHSNINLPEKFDKYLRLIVVTPDMHRVHHSVIMQETNSNFGFNLPFWDRIFKTYKAQPEKGHLNMQIGLKEYRDYKKTGLVWLLVNIYK
jgi:sterol desaturase/sphingolipid hydroxylase (fatty acid hydroxylase superfamily)